MYLRQPNLIFNIQIQFPISKFQFIYKKKKTGKNECAQSAVLPFPQWHIFFTILLSVFLSISKTAKKLNRNLVAGRVLRTNRAADIGKKKFPPGTKCIRKNEHRTESRRIQSQIKAEVTEKRENLCNSRSISYKAIKVFCFGGVWGGGILS